MRRPTVIVDPGPIVALFDADERHHDWARTQFESLDPPLLTCESVLSEACFLLRRVGADATMPVSLVRRGALRVVDAVSSEGEGEAVAALMRRYDNIPMSLADACLVHILERTESGSIMTLDSDFRIYRQAKRRGLPLFSPGL